MSSSFDPATLSPASQPDSSSTQEIAHRLVNWFSSEEYVIALSGGVDSCVVAKAAMLSGKKCTGFTSDSPSVPRKDIQSATEVANLLGLRHRIVPTSETADPNYMRNDGRRCYHCKSHLYQTIASEFPHETVVNGTNYDDLGDYRPGLDAASENRVRSPLAELKIGKQQVRELAAYWGLPSMHKPASPCLASRIAYGVAVTPERLAMIEAAEELLEQLGLTELRVRLHADNLARIEIPLDQIQVLLDSETRDTLVRSMKDLGFLYVTLDLSGFQSGSLNPLVQLTVH